MNKRPKVILLPGAVLPAELAYEALLKVFAGEVEAVAKELEVYAGNEPPTNYSLDVEVQGILRTAEDSGFKRFHLVGYSAGGASCLAFTAQYPDRLQSLTLLEPAWAGNEGRDPAEQTVWREYERIMALPPEEMMPAFIRANLAAGVKLSLPSGPTPPWMAKRPAGLAALTRAFNAAELDLDALRRFQRPVYFALGGLSNPNYYAVMAERLSRLFSDFTLEVFEKRHHFDPPHRIEPERLAASLHTLWTRATSST